MSNSSNYKMHLPVVKIFPMERMTSVAPRKLLLTKDKYYQKKVDDEWEQEYYIIYNSYEFKS